MGELPERYAAVIGINQYTYGVAELRSAVPDARAVAAALKQAHGYAEPLVLLDAEATRDGIVELLEKQLPALGLGPGSGLLFYYAGHGVAFDDEQVPRGYLIPCDARSGDQATWLSMDDVRQALHQLRCRHLLAVLDCCFAGSFRWTATRRWDLPTPWLYDSQYARYLDGVAWQVLTSASHEELAQDRVALVPGSRNNRDQEGQVHSPFAAALLEGLAGQSDSSRGKHAADGVITATELYQYIFEELVPVGAERRQTPGLWPLKPGNTGEYLFLSPDRERNTRPDPPLDDANNPWAGLETLDEAPTLEKLREAIEGPAAAKALFFEPGDLVDKLLDAVFGMPAALPLLVLTLAEMYRQAQLRRRNTGADRALTRQDYKAAGGVEGTVHRLADELYEKAAAEDLAATVRRLALRMVSFEGWALTRRRVSRGELKYAEPEERRRVARVVRRLTRAHLLVAGEKYLEPGHDALVRTWPRMSAWLEEAGDAQLLLRAVWGAASEWAARKRSEGLLWNDDPRLEELAAVRGDLNQLEQQFVEASAERRRREEAKARKIEDGRNVAVAGMLNVIDPTRAAMVLLEVANPAETPGAGARMLEVMVRPIAHSILRGHADAVVDAAFDAAGTRVVTASRDGTARVWSLGADNAGMPQVLSGHRAEVMSAAFNADGSRILTVGGDGTARVWNAADTGRQVVLRHPNAISADFNADGSKVLTAGGTSARVWNADGSGRPVVLNHDSLVESAALDAGGTKILTFSGDGLQMWNVDGSGPTALPGGQEDWQAVGASLSADGTKVVLLCTDNAARVWNVTGPSDGDPLPLRHDDWVRSAAFSTDGTRVVTTSDDGTAKVWDVGTPGGPGEPAVVLRHQAWVLKAAFSADGARVVSASFDGTAQLWDANLGQPPVVLRGHRARVLSAVFNADGSEIVTTSADGTARLWKVGARPGGGPRRTPSMPVVLRCHEESVERVGFNADGTRFVTASADGTARIWNLEAAAGGTCGQPVVLRGHQGGVQSAAFNANGTRVVTASADGTARVWNVDGSGEPTVLAGHTAQVVTAELNADGTKVVTASADGTARVWSLGARNASGSQGSGKPIVLKGHTDWLRSAAFNADGTRVVTAADDATVRIFQVDGSKGRSRAALVVLDGFEDVVGSAAFSADGSLIVAASWDGTARVYNADGSGEVVFPHKTETLPELFNKAVLSAAFDAEGARVVTACTDGAVRVWKVDGSGTPLVLRGHLYEVGSATFNAAGTQVLSASYDGTARVWTLDGSREPVVLRHQERGYVAAAFHPAGTHVVTASWDGILQLWTVDAGRLQAVLRTSTSACLDPELRVNVLRESPVVAWKKYAECELGHGRCPRAWGFDPTDPRSAEPFLARLSPEAREKYEQYRSLLPPMPLPEKRRLAGLADRHVVGRAMPGRTARSADSPERRRR